MPRAKKARRALLNHTLALIERRCSILALLQAGSVATVVSCCGTFKLMSDAGMPFVVLTRLYLCIA